MGFDRPVSLASAGLGVNGGPALPSGVAWASLRVAKKSASGTARKTSFCEQKEAKKLY
jgi:hypothetical protein